MRVLLIHSGNVVGKDSSKYTFVKEQGDALEQLGCQVDYFSVVGKGFWGYLSNYNDLRKKIKEFQPNIIHAHYGLCGILACLQNKVPVVTTFHNGETHQKGINFITSLFSLKAKHVIFVAQHIRDLVYFKAKNYTILPCGINLNDCVITDYAEARKQLGYASNKKYILFGGAFTNLRKNYPLLKNAVDLLPNKDNIEIVEMKGFTRSECILRMSACDVFALPTKSEGSPQTLKEAIAMCCPIVATDVADIAHLLGDIKGHYLLRNPRPTKEKWEADAKSAKELSQLLIQALSFEGRTEGRSRIIELGLSNSMVAEKIYNIYIEILKDEKA